jgi:septal ring-binding cell division protein DamX
VADTPSRKEGNVRSRIVLLVGALILALSIVGIGTALAASSMHSSHTTSRATHSTTHMTARKMTTSKTHAKAKAAMATKKKAMFTG